MNLLINLNPADRVPLHRQLYEELQRMILSGHLPAGEKLPSTRTLSKLLGVSRATVTASYETLLSEGYLEAATGSGTYVSRHLPEEMLRPPSAEVAIEQSGLDDKKGEVCPPGSAAGMPGSAVAGMPGSAVAGTAGAAKSLERSGDSAFRGRLSWYGSSLSSREWRLSFRDEEPEIQFSFGRPDFREFPMRQWMQLCGQHARRRDLSTLDFPSRAQGYLPLRQALAGYLGRARAVDCSADQIIIVNGSQQGIDLVTRVLIDKDDPAAIEEPGYLGAQQALLAQGAHILPVSVDQNGLRVDELRRRVQDLDVPPKLVYVTPSHQFPTGVHMSLSRRLDLLSWASRNGTFVIEDDYDSEYRYKGRPIPALAGLSHGGSVIYIGTFSKVLLPALRLGYLVVPPSMVTMFSRAKWLADRHSPLLEQQVLADFITQGHLERHIRRMRALYENRRAHVLRSISQLFQGQATVYGDNAGINVLVRFNTTLSDDELAEGARRAGVGITSTGQFYLGLRRHGEFLLNYGGLSEEEISEGLRRIAVFIRTHDS